MNRNQADQSTALPSLKVQLWQVESRCNAFFISVRKRKMCDGPVSAVASCGRGVSGRARATLPK